MDFIAESVVIGLVEQAPLVLAAIGFALIYRLTGLINVAYAETLTLGAYFAIWLTKTFGLDFYTVLVPTADPLRAPHRGHVCAHLPARQTARRGRPRNRSSSRSACRSSCATGSSSSSAIRPSSSTCPPPDTVPVLGVGVTSFRLVALATVGLLALVLYLFIQRTDYGLQVRALASDEQLAKVSGIRPLVVTVMIWFIAGVAGGLAGAFLGVGSSVSPLLGWRQFLFILLIVLVGVRWGSAASSSWAWPPPSRSPPWRSRSTRSYYSQLLLIVGFIILLKWRGRRLTETAKV